jgi:translation initiation factor 3 subunit B
MAPIHPDGQLDDFMLDENGELDFSDLERQYAVPREEGFDQVIVVDNCPVVEEGTRKDKLIAFIRKIFSTNGTIKPDGIYMPMKKDEETGTVSSQGYLSTL